MNFTTPSGFRDVLSDEALQRERITRDVQQCFADQGYVPLETPTLEVMDVLQVGGRLPGALFKFFDSKGDLVAMRPDVTLQVARMCASRLKGEAGPFRFRYTQRVFREAEGERESARELTQFGIECIGERGAASDAEIVGLFARALRTSGVGRFVVALATVGPLRALLDRSGAPEAWKEAVLTAYHASDFVELDRLTGACGADAGSAAAGANAFAGDFGTCGIAPAYANAVRLLPRIRGGREAIDEARELVAPLGCADGLDDLARTFDLLSREGLEDILMVDFSVMSSFDYYTGIVFAAYSPYLGSALGSGGRYDHMMGVYGADRPAAGFAFFLEQAMAASVAENDLSAAKEADAAEGRASGLSVPPASLASFVAPVPSVSSARPLRIAVPKGSLNPDAVAALAAAGLDVSGLDCPGRQLVIRNGDVEFVIVRPTDAPMFVALGAADCGICGKDSLLEAALDVVELTDLKFGECRFVVAEPAGATSAVDDHYRTLGSIRVATKYPRITRAHYAASGVPVEIVKLHGNIELAPLTGMAERIVDITATGTTLRENNLVIVEDVLSSTARFFANTCAFRTDSRIVRLARALQEQAAGKTYDPVPGGATPVVNEVAASETSAGVALAASEMPASASETFGVLASAASGAPASAAAIASLPASETIAVAESAASPMANETKEIL